MYKKSWEIAFVIHPVTCETLREEAKFRYSTVLNFTGVHFAIFEISGALLSLNYVSPILEYFWKNSTFPVDYYLPVYF